MRAGRSCFLLSVLEHCRYLDIMNIAHTSDIRVIRPLPGPISISFSLLSRTTLLGNAFPRSFLSIGIVDLADLLHHLLLSLVHDRESLLE